MPGLGTSFGRGGATTAQQDLSRADCILIQGSSMAEAHPVGFRWVMAARERGAAVIHVDPRYARTSAMADIHVPIRAGSDIAFLGALIRHIIDNDLYFREYVVRYTNASCIVRSDFQDTEDLDGLFSGWDDEKGRYDSDSWRYEGDEFVHPKRDPTLQHPRCVFQILKRHYSRYVPAIVQRVCGVPPELFERVAHALVSASGPEKTAAICYAVGWTQHSKGVQIIRTASILQLLLGNIGRPGGGILALRGHASIQGSTDIPTLYDILPGYLRMPRHGDGEEALAGWLKNHQRQGGLWHGMPAYIISLLRAYYGRNATKQNDWGWTWIPRITGDHSHFSYFTRMEDGEVEGLFIMGQNPAVGGQHSRFERRAMSRLRWLVVRDMVETESANFWYASPEIERDEIRTEQIDTEVFLFPAAGHTEKEGAFTNTQRMLQWRQRAIEATSGGGDRRSDAWFVHQLAKRLKAKAFESNDPIHEPLRMLDWWYPEDEEGGPETEAVLAEINGWRTSPRTGAEGDDAIRDEGRRDVSPEEAAKSGISGKSREHGGPPGALYWKDRHDQPHHGAQIEGYRDLKDDGSTACGCWIYSGVFGPDGVNKALRRSPVDFLGHGWGFAWPGDRRILYNRASADPDGAPWSEAKRLVWWSESESTWSGDDVPDFPTEKSPGYEPKSGATGTDAHAGDAPFTVHDDGLGWIYVPRGLADGPLPTHYEPLESPLRNALYTRQTNPPVNWFARADNPFAPPEDSRFPYVLTTYRLTEHHTAGGMSRFLSHLSELQPAMFVELSPELASIVGVENGGWVTVVTLRGLVEARTLVTRRIRPLTLNGRTVHQVAMPFHFGAAAGLVRGDSANDLIPLSGEPNVSIHEGKALVCDVIAGRRPGDRSFVAWMRERFPEAHGEAATEHLERHEAGGGHGVERPGGHGEEGRS